MEFRPGAFLDFRNPSPEAFLIILNAPIQNFAVFQRIWASSKYRICADGGANRLHDLFEVARKNYKDPSWQRDDFLPDLIHGDLDSLRPDVRTYYAARAVSVTQDEDKYSTDFGKVVGKLRQLVRHEARSHQDVLILGSLAGRVDQGIGLLHEMYREARQDVDIKNAAEYGPRLRLWLYSESSCSFVLHSGRSRIVTALERNENGVDDTAEERRSLFSPNVGLLPIYGPAAITTKGMEWDVHDWKTEMGGQVSTSNHVVDLAAGAEVETDHEVLFTIELADL